MRLFLLAATTAQLLALIHAQAADLPFDCIGSISSFPNCQTQNSILTKCNKFGSSPEEKPQLISCFCTPELFSAHVGCKGEFRLCALSNTYDIEFDQMINDWHAVCDDKLTGPITTPPLPISPMIVKQGPCLSIYESCVRLEQKASSCKSAYSAPADLKKCRCQQEMLSLASICEIDGSVSCMLATPVSTKLWEDSYCRGAGVVTTQNTASATDPPVAGGRTVTDSIIVQVISTSPSRPRESASPVQTSSLSGGVAVGIKSVPLLEVLVITGFIMFVI